MRLLLKIIIKKILVVVTVVSLAAFQVTKCSEMA